jgi:hypothetical protein
LTLTMRLMRTTKALLLLVVLLCTYVGLHLRLSLSRMDTSASNCSVNPEECDNRGDYLTQTHQLTRPHNVANLTKPVKVFVLMGQSNMFGFANVRGSNDDGTLVHTVTKKGRYKHLMNENATKWTTSQNVRSVHVINEPFEVRTNEWLTVNVSKRIGPDLQIGHILGEVLGDQPILLLKACMGSRSLGWDLLPPGSKSFEYKGYIYAGYSQSPQRWKKGTEPVPSAWYAGKQYDIDTSNIKRVLADLSTYYPGATEYEIAAFVWWQGFSDVIMTVFAQRYEANLARLIQSLRADLNASDAKFVIATVAFRGKDVSSKTSKRVGFVAEAQLAVGNAEKHPEFAGTVKSVDVRPVWRKTGPAAGAWHHYWHNAEFVVRLFNFSRAVCRPFDLKAGLTIV